MAIIYLFYSFFSFATLIINTPIHVQVEHNSNADALYLQKPTSSFDQVQLYAEFQPTKYLVMSFSSENTLFNNVNKSILKELDNSIRLVLIITDETHRNKAYEFLSSLISQERFRIVNLQTHGPFPQWNRDSWPIVAMNNKNELVLIGTKYFQNFEPEEFLKNVTNLRIDNHNYFFEGGNILANSVGDCFTVDNPTTKVIPSVFFEVAFGCLRLHRLPHTFGIGHVDEVFRFVNNNTVLVDDIELAEYMKQHGFNTYLLPRPKTNYNKAANYLNVLQINNKIYLPYFDVNTDYLAKDIYKELGYEVIPIDMKWFSTDGLIHCSTKTYPKGVFDFLF